MKTRPISGGGKWTFFCIFHAYPAETRMEVEEKRLLHSNKSLMLKV
jgi:hypothetical protein